MMYVTNCAIILRQIAQFAIWLLNLDIAQEPCAISRLLCIIRIPKMHCAIPGLRKFLDCAEHIYWHRMDLTLVGSSPSTGRCAGATRKFSSSACTWRSLSSGHFPSGSPHRSLDGLLSFRGSEGSSDVVLCTNTAEVVCQGRHLARAQHIRVSGRVTSVPTV